ncbi:MAG: phosphatase PAP2 family protein [Candidatus Woesearchaeota archaeon]
MNIIRRLFTQMMQDISAFGSLSFFGVCIVVLYALGEFTLSVKLLFGIILLFMTYIPLRLLFFHARPKKISYKTLIEKIDASSFPSMHTGRMGLFVALTDFSLLAIFLAFLVCYSRYYCQKHYVVDITYGFLIGLIIGIILLVL